MPDSPTGPVAIAKQYLDENLGTRVSLDELAKIVKLSRFHFARKFKSETGMSPLQYHLTKRIEKAEAMLLAGQSSVEVSRALGFSDDSHFSRHFKRITGRTPGSVRNQGDQ